MIFSKSPLSQFSTYKTIAKKTFDKFSTKYAANVQAFRQKM